MASVNDLTESSCGQWVGMTSRLPSQCTSRFIKRTTRRATTHPKASHSTSKNVSKHIHRLPAASPLLLHPHAASAINLSLRSPSRRLIRPRLPRRSDTQSVSQTHVRAFPISAVYHQHRENTACIAPHAAQRCKTVKARIYLFGITGSPWIGDG